MKENVKKQVVNFIKVFTVFTIFVSLIVSLGVPKSAISIGGGGEIIVKPLEYSLEVMYVDTNGDSIDSTLDYIGRLTGLGKTFTAEIKTISGYEFKGYYYSNLLNLNNNGSQNQLLTTNPASIHTLNDGSDFGNILGTDGDLCTSELEIKNPEATCKWGYYSMYMVYDAVTADKYSVTYDANGGTGTVTDATQYDANTDATIKASTGMTKVGFEFEAWNTAADGSGTTYAPNATLTMTSNVTLFAQWKPTTVSENYTVRYNMNGGSGTLIDNNSPYASNSEVTILGTTATKYGYRFDGWNTLPDGTGTTYIPNEKIIVTSNIVLFAQWTLLPKYNIVYDANSGVGSITDNFNYVEGTSAKVKEITGITKTGFEFDGWNTAADGSGTTYAPKTIFTITSNLTLFAQWKAVAVEKYTVTYDANGGTGTVTDATQYDANTDATIKASTGMSKTGFEFEAWNTAADGSGTTYAPNATLTMTSNVTLFAQWKAVVGAVEQYTITYDANGGTGTVTDATQYDANTDAIVKASTGMTKTGFEFVSWNTVADGSGTTYAADGVITMTGNITLFAQWKALPVTPDPITPTTPTTPTKLPQTGDNSAIYLIELLLGLGVLIGSKVVIGKKF